MERGTILVILTNSVDGTADALTTLAEEAGQRVFRWNIDLWQQYALSCDGRRWLISDPLGRSIDLSAPESLVLWRKPFLTQMSFEGLALEVDDEIQARRQMEKFLQSVVALAQAECRVRLVEPYADRRVPKLYQLHAAREIYAIPRSHFGTSAAPELPGQTIAKPLGDPGVGENHIFYTRRVDPEHLFRPFPWFLQEALVGGRDVTCVYIVGRCHFYVCDFARGMESMDWRVEINTESQSEWHKLQHPNLAEWRERTVHFMESLGLYYGRLDFILKEDTLYFLECNSNGQFGWLDDEASLELHREFLSAALRPESAVG